MGSQIALIATTDDLVTLLTAARQAGTHAVPEFIPPDQPPELHDPETLFRSNPGNKIYLLPGDLEPVEIFTIPRLERSEVERVNDRTSPVVEVLPSQISSQAIRSGRLYLALSPSDRLYPSAKNLFDLLKRNMKSWDQTKQYGVRVGPQALEKVKNQGLILESMSGEPLTLNEAKHP